MRERRLLAAMAVAAACTLTAGVVAVAADGARVTGRPLPRAGRPGNPVVVPGPAFTFSAAAGSVVHVRLAAPLDVPLTGQARRYDFTTTGDWGSFTLVPDPLPPMGSSFAGWQAATVRPRTVCGTDPACPAGERIDYFEDSYRQQVPAGSYLLAVAGPEGATVSFTLRSYDEAAPVTRVRDFYRLPYRTSRIAAEPVSAQDAVLPTQHEFGNWLTPTIGRHMLAGVVVGVGTKSQDNLQYTLCPGGSTGSETTHGASDGAGFSCKAGGGYGLYGGTVTSAHKLDTAGRYVFLVTGTGHSTWEGYTGAAYTLGCDGGDCATYAVGYAFGLDT
jgi:hypothetical protein